MERFKRIRQKWYRKWEICCGYFCCCCRLLCSFFCWPGIYAFGQKQTNCVNWKTNENEAKNTHSNEKKSERENRKEENKNIKRFSEWEKEKAIAWMDWATANNVNNFISSLFLSPQLNAEESWESFSSFYVITLRLVSLFFSIIPFFLTFPFLFVASLLPILCRDFYFSSSLIMRIPFGHSHICC